MHLFFQEIYMPRIITQYVPLILDIFCMVCVTPCAQKKKKKKKLPAHMIDTLPFMKGIRDGF